MDAKTTEMKDRDESDVFGLLTLLNAFKVCKQGKIAFKGNDKKKQSKYIVMRNILKRKRN